MNNLQTICEMTLTKKAVQNEMYNILCQHLPGYDLVCRQLAYQLQREKLGIPAEVYRVPGRVKKIIIDYPTRRYAATAGNMDFFGAVKLELIETKE